MCLHSLFALEHKISKSSRRLNREIIVELDLERQIKVVQVEEEEAERRKAET